MTDKIITFDTHPKSKYWSSKNDIKPNQINISSHKKFIFDCNICNHEFDTSLSNIIRNISSNY